MEPLNASNYFELFSIPEQYHLNTEDLADRYRKLQAQIHPDRVAGGTDQEKIQAIQATSLLNEAFQTLRSPQSRAAYLLHLHEIDVEQVSQSDLDPDLLLEQIRLREELEDIPRDEGSIERLDGMREKMETRLSEVRNAFAQAFDQTDLGAARQCYFEMQYLAKLVADIESVEEDLLGY